MKRVKEADDPRRCQHVFKTQQCWSEAVEGGKMCMRHGGNKEMERNARESLHNYRIGKFQAQLERHADSPAIKSLRDEIAILRMSLEERLMRCNDATDLILQSGPISDMVMKIDRVVNSCHKLESNMGQHLDRQSIIRFASKLINIIANELDDDETVANIAQQILEVADADKNSEHDG